MIQYIFYAKQKLLLKIPDKKSQTDGKHKKQKSCQTLTIIFKKSFEMANIM